MRLDSGYIDDAFDQLCKIFTVVVLCSVIPFKFITKLSLTFDFSFLIRTKQKRLSCSFMEYPSFQRPSPHCNGVLLYYCKEALFGTHIDDPHTENRRFLLLS